jgi:signal peptidase I
VKRLVGLPGDTLEMRGKQLFLNGAPLDEPYARYIDREADAVHPGMAWQEAYLVPNPRRRTYRPSRDSWGPIVVPREHFFVLGDNRDNSEDSRYWGFVDREAVKGRPWFVYYSFDPARVRGVPWVRDIRWDRIGGSSGSAAPHPPRSALTGPLRHRGGGCSCGARVAPS